MGGFRDPWGPDDLDFYLRVVRASEGVCYAGPAVTRYRRCSASTSRDGERMLRGIRTVYARQRPFVDGDATFLGRESPARLATELVKHARELRSDGTGTSAVRPR